MKKLVAVLIVVVAGIVIADTMPPAPVSHVPGQEQGRRKRKRVSPEMQMQRFGGFVTQEYNGRYCYMMNAQKRVPQGVLDQVAAQILRALSLPIKVESCDIKGNDNFSPIRTAWSGDRKTGAVVSLVDLQGWGTLLVAPEDGWVQINIAALAKDNPSAEVLELRLKKELWRGFILLFGGGNAHIEGDLMRPVNSLADLDSKPNQVPGPEPFNAVMDGARARGISIVRRTTYKQACIEGWAPTPTNEFQQAIWEQVRSDKERGPTNPIRILPEKK